MSDTGAYGVDAANYLARCKERLLEDSPASLFYAAFELRCCVEARLAEYIEHFEPYKKKRVQLFKIGDNAKLVQQIKAGTAIACFGIPIAEGVMHTEYHTPVPEALKIYCEKKVDRLRHAQTKYRSLDDPWWSETRNELIEAYRLAWFACQGNMPLPAMWSKKGGNSHPVIFRVTDANRGLLTAMRHGVGQHFSAHISYVENPYDLWTPDL